MWRTRDQAHVTKQRIIWWLPIKLGMHACMRARSAGAPEAHPLVLSKIGAVKNFQSAQYTHSSVIERRGVHV